LLIIAFRKTKRIGENQLGAAGVRGGGGGGGGGHGAKGWERECIQQLVCTKIRTRGAAAADVVVVVVIYTYLTPKKDYTKDLCRA